MADCVLQLVSVVHTDHCMTVKRTRADETPALLPSGPTTLARQAQAQAMVPKDQPVRNKDDRKAIKRTAWINFGITRIRELAKLSFASSD